MQHPACDGARHLMQLALAGTEGDQLRRHVRIAEAARDRALHPRAGATDGPAMQRDAQRADLQFGGIRFALRGRCDPLDEVGGGVAGQERIAAQDGNQEVAVVHDALDTGALERARQRAAEERRAADALAYAAARAVPIIEPEPFDEDSTRTIC